MNKPENCRDEQLDYLDDLRESGVTNMFGAVATCKRSSILKQVRRWKY